MGWHLGLVMEAGWRSGPQPRMNKNAAPRTISGVKNSELESLPAPEDVKTAYNSHRNSRSLMRRTRISLSAYIYNFSSLSTLSRSNVEDICIDSAYVIAQLVRTEKIRFRSNALRSTYHEAYWQWAGERPIRSCLATYVAGIRRSTALTSNSDTAAFV